MLIDSDHDEKTSGIGTERDFESVTPERFADTHLIQGHELCIQDPALEDGWIQTDWTTEVRR